MSAMGNRVLHAARLSRYRDEETAIERQLKDLNKYSSTHGLTVVAEVIDDDISALSYSAFDKKRKISVWLNSKADQFDILSVWRLDRICRGLGDMYELIQWAKAHDKRLHFVTGAVRDIDFTDETSTSELIALIVGWAAQLEGITVKERVRSAQAHHRNQGNFHGGPPPYGYRAQKVGTVQRLVRDSKTAPILREIVERLLEGHTMDAVARDLQSRNILTPLDHLAKSKGKPGKNRRWVAATISKIVANRTYLGETTYYGETLFADDGTVIPAAEPLMTLDEYERVAAKKASRNAPGRTKVNVKSLLLGVVVCGDCGGVLNRYTSVTPYNTYLYLRCTSCGTRVRAENLEKVFVDVFLSQVGSLEVHKREYVRGTDNSVELARIEQNMKMLEDALSDNTLSDPSRFPDLMAKLSVKREMLKTDASAPSHYEWVPTGITYRDWWESADFKARRQLLLDSEVQGRAGKGDPGISRSPMRWPLKSLSSRPGEVMIAQYRGPADLGTNSYLWVSWHGDLADRLASHTSDSNYRR